LRKWTWARIILYGATAVVAVAAAVLIYLTASRFAYYDNGEWVHTNLLTVYAISWEGYGRDPVPERRLESDWGSNAAYAARNFTLDLAGLDYSQPLQWGDLVAGPGLWIMRSTKPTVWTESVLYASGGTVPPGQKVQVKVQVVGDNGLALTEQGLAFSKAYSLTLYRPRYSSVAYVVEVSEPEPGAVLADIRDSEAAEDTVRKYLEATRNNNYEAWRSTLKYDWTWVDSSVIKMSIDKVQVSAQHTYRIREMYTGSELAKRRGYSDEQTMDIVAVFAQYAADYDNTKVPYGGGTLARYIYLMREDTDSPWLIWDSTSMWDIPPS
jgi:hypothetical protein